MFPNGCHLTSSEAFKPQLGLVMIWGTVFALSVVSLFPTVITYIVDISLHKGFKSSLLWEKKKCCKCMTSQEVKNLKLSFCTTSFLCI